MKLYDSKDFVLLLNTPEWKLCQDQILLEEMQVVEK